MYVLLANSKSTNFNLLAGDLLGTSLPLDNSIQPLQELRLEHDKFWEPPSWKRNINSRTTNRRRLFRHARTGDPWESEVLSFLDLSYGDEADDELGTDEDTELDDW